MSNTSAQSEMEIRLGTSGYSFTDWVGSFYPPGTSRGGMLAYYSSRFSTVEVNSTYYRIMHPKVSWNMVNKTPEGFEFFIKLHSSMTHSRNATKDQWNDFNEMLKPFIEVDKLSGLLAQFPYSFKPSDEGLRYIEELNEETNDISLAVEFRYDEWYRQEILDRISAKGIALVTVDLPKLPHLPPPQAIGGKPFGYIRFHGRNARQWWNGGPLRYDYSYSNEELRSWLPVINRLGSESGRIFVMFNNCHFGQAVKDAIRMDELFKGE